MDLVILRHGETAWTITGQHTGTTELELTARGEDEARQAGDLLRHLLAGTTPVATYVSPRRRARRTAELALPGVEVVVEPLLAEVAYGEAEGRTQVEVEEAHPGWSVWLDGGIGPDAEEPDHVVARAQRFLRQRVPAEGTVVAVTHGHFSRFLAITALGLPPSTGSILTSGTASLSRLRHVRGRVALDLWNATPSLTGRPS